MNSKNIRTQLRLLQPLLKSSSLESIRKGQNLVGELMEAKHRSQVLIKKHPFEAFTGCWSIPSDERRQGVILYLHGGGYTCGDLEYAKGFGATLSVHLGIRVFCAAYRLAPEHPFPAALEDALESYQYLLSKDYDPKSITLCGESAGGGLCFSLCLRLKALGLPLPGSIVALSPWTDLTASGSSYEKNREQDPSVTGELLDFFASCYTKDRKDPLVSPLFGDLTRLPPCLILCGGDEIMLSDSENLHSALLAANVKSQLVVKPQRWHAYLLYGLTEDLEDFSLISKFLNQYASEENKLRWMRLDNAAKIYPAALRQNWSNVFRLSITLTEEVDIPVLQSALDVTVRRFPSIAARLRRGAFWYYLQQLKKSPRIREESSYPLTPMSREDIRQCAFRVIVYGNRIAVEFFHSLTDGTGGLIFLKTLTAEYLQQKHGITIPAQDGVVGRLEDPSLEELEDSFQKYAGPRSASRKATDAWDFSGTPEPRNFLHVTCFELPVQEAVAKAHEYGVSLTAFLAAAILQALQHYQRESVPDIRFRTPLKIMLPVNLRRLFPSRTLRNFSLYTTPEIDPRLGEYSFPEICRVVHHHMGLDVTAKRMSRVIATNVNSERNPIVKIMPLFLKNLVMRMVFDAVGERKSCLSLSNLGQVQVPPQMQPYVQRMDFILGVQASAPYNCGVVSYGDTLYLNFIRNIKESILEYHFHRVLQDLGLTARVQSNRP